MGGTTSPRSVAAELGLSLTATISMNQANVRTLAGVGGSGTQWSMSSLYGKSNTYTIEFLVVAGGGGADRSFAGGGGGGGALSGSGYAVSPGTAYSITIGGGGSAGIGGGATNGSNSSAFGQTPSGGGRGGSSANTACSGGSGGGGGSQSPRTGGSGTAGQGGSGGNQRAGCCTPAGAGGGGAGPANGGACFNPPPGPANNFQNIQGGPGGNGRATTLRGSTEYFGGGGGGGAYYNCNFVRTPGVGGLGGGGNGGGNGKYWCLCIGQWAGPCIVYTPQNGGTNTGGGAGGGQGGIGSPQFANGGSGIVILRYPGAQRGSGGTVTSAGGYTIHTFTSSGTYTA